ncbi:unnamed protein product [Didymodactylos carnosus]|uniref:Uncharacterized protein n=1 Tax=Didymodactylos carnosus TaxID=1234261 RepID=A0A813WT51_9BILA|nr:unnamed protein product [Didymodactylos carnosus]CAF1075182.1 unnamed protein product [Didymodactylos carnosus]CAF3645930.1 unnamed protein product [Didymodactylos carnosus]CAF3839015.1 unnamed protein product [Didymodactylos carnosus]
MLLDTNKLSLIYNLWKLNDQDDYIQEVCEFSRKLTDSDVLDAQCIQQYPDLIYLVELWEQRSYKKLDDLYESLLNDVNFSDKLDAILRFFYDVQSYDLVRYLLEKNVQYYHTKKFTKGYNGFHEASAYGFSAVCSMFLKDKQKRYDVNEPFTILYTSNKTHKTEVVSNLTALQLVCIWSKYFPKRFRLYAHTQRILLDAGARVNMISTELTSPLHWASREPHTTQMAKELLERGAIVNCKDKMNIMPIHYACWARNSPLVELLIKHGAQLCVADELGRTAIHFLCMPSFTNKIIDEDEQIQQCDLLELLIKMAKNENETTSVRPTVDLNVQDIQGHNLLMYACVSHNLKLMALLLKHQPTLLNQTNVDQQSALMIAIDESFIDGINFLLKQEGLERNLQDSEGNTAIHHACICTNIEQRATILQLLIVNGGFDLEKQNKHQQDPVMLCILQEQIDLFKILIDKTVTLTKKDLESRQCIHLACQIGNYELVDILLKCPNINLNVKDEQQRNCLYYAISNGNLDIINLLINKNVQINITDQVGDTPLHLAVVHPTNAFNITKTLLQTKDGKELLNQPSGDGVKPLILAANSKAPDVVRLLMKNGVDCTVVDNDRRTALHLACASGCIKTVLYLIEIGNIDVNSVDVYQQTPMFYAFISNEIDIARYLMTCGAKLNVRDAHGYLPLHSGILLSSNEHDYNVEFIDLCAYEKLSLDDNDNESGLSPLGVACMQGKLNVVEYLIEKYHVDLYSVCNNGHSILNYATTAQNENSVKIVEILIKNGCSPDKIDHPKGSFMYTICQHGQHDATIFFIKRWLNENNNQISSTSNNNKIYSNINELHYGETILDLLFKRAELNHLDIDVDILLELMDNGATFYSTKFDYFPLPLINDCPLFYVTLLRQNCPSIPNIPVFIFHLLNSITLWPETYLTLYKTKSSLTICEYFYLIVQLAYTLYSVPKLFFTIEKYFLHQLDFEQPNEQIIELKTQLQQLQSKTLTLGEYARKLIRKQIKIPSKHNLNQLGLSSHLVNFLRFE